MLRVPTCAHHSLTQQLAEPAATQPGASKFARHSEREDYADIVQQAAFAGRLVGHSMGGLTALMRPDRILSFVDIEGNIAPEDCFLSRQIVDYPADDPEVSRCGSRSPIFRRAAIADEPCTQCTAPL